MQSYLIQTEEPFSLEMIELISDRVKKYDHSFPKNIEFVNNPDLHIYTFADGLKSISIDVIRQLQTDILYNPKNSQTALYIIHPAEKLSPEAQNCLLKTLEEPPSYAKVLLFTQNRNKILETIHSRCQFISLAKNTDLQNPQDEDNKIDETWFADFLAKKPISRFVSLDEFNTSKDGACQFLKSIILLSQKLPKGDQADLEKIKYWAHIISITQEAYTDAQSNVNIKLLLDNWALNL